MIPIAPCLRASIRLQLLQLQSQKRTFTLTIALTSGHSRWSKIRHDKGKNDAQRGNDFSKIAIEIIEVTKRGGPDPTVNLSLQYALAKAKKAGMTKAGISSAINRGQGISSTGAPLEPMLVEAIGPASIAFVISCLTDSKPRTLQNIRNIIRSSEYTVAPTAWLFERKGYLHVSAPVVTEKPPAGGNQAAIAKEVELSPEEVRAKSEKDLETLIDLALENDIGLDDVFPTENETNLFEVTINDIALTASAEKELLTILPEGWEVRKSGLQYVPNEETMVQVEEEGDVAEQVRVFVEKLEEEGDVVEIYDNASFM